MPISTTPWPGAVGAVRGERPLNLSLAALLIVFSIREVAGFFLSLLLLRPHIFECGCIEYNPDRIVPAQIGMLDEDRAHLLLRFLGTLIVLSSIVAIKSSNSLRSSSLRWKAR